jgi:alpha-N-arabinofuranosidase
LNEIKIDPERTISNIERNIFGGFAEHLGRCIYGGIYDPDSPLADEEGLRIDVIKSLRRLRLPVIRYPGGNFASGYHWMDGVGPVDERPAKTDLAWQAVETNHFGTNEFINFCHKTGSEPYLVANCGDGDMREARDWVEYCNGMQDTTLVRQRNKHGFTDPHGVRYWGIGNEVDGPWQIGYKTPQEYARTFTEFGKVMKLVDPRIKLIASAVSLWEGDFTERAQLLVEQAGNLIDYMALHWYVGNPDNNFAAYMALSELIEERLRTYEALLQVLCLKNKIKRPIPIAVDEWNVWYRTHPKYQEVPSQNKLEEIYNLEDALVVAMHLNAFIRHANSVRMANIAQIVNVIAPIFTRSDGLVLQTIFYPFELYRNTCGRLALDVWWQGETFSGGDYSGVRTLDVSATLDETLNQLVVYVVNRSLSEAIVTTVRLTTGQFVGDIQAKIINGLDIKVENTFDKPDSVAIKEIILKSKEQFLNCVFEPHSITALVCPIS